MNVLFILSHYPGFGGIEKVTSVISSYLNDCGIGVTICSFGSNSPELESDIPHEICLKYVPEPLVYNSSDNKIYIENLLKKESFDFVILQDSYAPIENLLFSINYQWETKLITVEHNTPLYGLMTVKSYFYINNSLSWKIYRFIKFIPSIVKSYIQSSYRHWLLLKKSKYYVILSESFIREIKLLTGRKYMAKIRVISNPLTIPPSANGSFCSEKKQQMVFVGRLTHQKGLPFLLDIWKKFSACCADWHLLIIGEGPDYQMVVDRINNENIHNIELIRPTRDIIKYYEESRILMLTSIYEGFGLVLVESMSRYCVPICFGSYASVYDIIQDEVNGRIIRPFDIDDYCNALLKLTNEPEYLEFLSVNAANTISKFSVSSIGEKWLKLLS